MQEKLNVNLQASQSGGEAQGDEALDHMVGLLMGEEPDAGASGEGTPSKKTEPQHGKADKNPCGILYKKASEIEAKPTRWLWKGRIARGKVTMLAGHPGLGKSQLTASMAAVVSTGGCWPVDLTRCELGNVVIFSAEDDAADTIRPRLEAAGAALDRVVIVDPAPVEDPNKNGRPVRRSFSLEDDLPRLGNLLAELKDVALVVIDPVTAYLGQADGNQNAEIRALLTPLSELAAHHGAAIVCVSHFNKGGNGESLMRIMGSLAFVAAARAAFAVLADPDDKARLLFLPIKNNIGNDKTGLAFHIQGAFLQSPKGEIETSHVVWEPEAVTMTANEVLEASLPGGKSATEEAGEWLRDLLTNGPLQAADVLKEARQAGIGDKALRTARERLCKRPFKREFVGGWWWELKGAEDAQKVEDAQVAYIRKQGILGGGGHLRGLISDESGQDGEEELPSEPPEAFAEGGAIPPTPPIPTESDRPPWDGNIDDLMNESLGRRGKTQGGGIK